jgi:serine/threonine protein kinase
MIGKTISHYKIIEKLGSGGMGVVYKAEDLKLDRLVALKFLPPHFTTSDEEQQRFIHEAKAASSLDHTNICNIYEIDETVDGQLFISMAYYEGETLNKKIKEKPLPLEEAIDIAIQISQGLTQAHEKEIIHRDIKPANIMLTKKGVVKVLDFGLAKLAKQTKLTKDGTTLGTIAYMSPEQARGDEVDHRTDIWSLGVILYEMLTGQSPFKGDYDQAVVYSIINDEFEPITGLRTGLPMELEGIITKCLQKSPADRYQHVDELVVDLRSLQRESEYISTPPTKKRSKTLFVSSAILLIFILVVTGYFLTYEQDKGEIADAGWSKWENSIAVLPFDNISADAEQEYFCDGMTEQIISNLSRIARLKVISRTSVMKYKATNKTTPVIGKELNVAYVLEGSIRKFENRIRVTAQLISTKDDFHVWSEDYDRELEDVFEVQDDVSQAIASNLLSTLSIQEIAEIKTDRPNNIEHYDRYMQTKGFHYKFLETQNPDYLRDAILLLKEILKREPDYLSANVELADAYNTYWHHLAKTDEEKSRYLQLQKKFLDISFRLNPTSLDVLYIKMIVSFVERGLDYFGEMRFKDFMEYLKINPNHALAYFYVGIWLREYDLVHQSLLCLDKSVELDPLFTWNLSNRGWAHFLIGEYGKTELDYKKAFEIEPYYYYNLGRYIHFLISFKRIKEAEKLIIQWQDKKPSDKNLHQLRAWLYAAKGDKENALSSFNKTTFEKKYDASFSRAIVYLL